MMDSTENKLSQEQIWDAVAHKWKEFRTEPHKPAIEFLKKNTKPGSKVLDFGCGSGRNFVELKGSRIYGTDFSGRMILFARENARKKGLYVELRKTNNERIPFDDKYLDIGICVAVIHCVDSPIKREALLRELFRVMKRDSKVFITVWSKNHERIKKKTGEQFVPWTIDGQRYNRYYYIYEQKEFKALLEKVGFEVEKITEDENINVIVRKP